MFSMVFFDVLRASCKLKPRRLLSQRLVEHEVLPVVLEEGLRALRDGPTRLLKSRRRALSAKKRAEMNHF